MLNNFPTELLFILLGFGLILLSAKEIGQQVQKRIGIPLISGFILTGVFAGPYFIGFFPKDIADQLWFIDWIALPFIAFAAGAEIHFSELRQGFGRIVTIVFCLVTTVLLLGTGALILLQDSIPFLQSLPLMHVFAIALMGGTILIAKSPSSTIAVIKELRAKGDFTQTVLGITILMDAVIIIIFAINSSITYVILNEQPLNFGTIALVLLEVAVDIGLGYLIAQFFRVIFFCPISDKLQWIFSLGVGFSVFYLAHALHDYHPLGLPIHLFSEPLLVCMVAGLVVANFLPCRTDFERFIEEVAPAIFIIFFTAVGATLQVSFLMNNWFIILIFITIRFGGMYVGSAIGSILTGGSSRQTRYLGLSFITQAGISLSLAKEVAVAYPEWGGEFAALFIGVIVLNTLLGPPFFKLALIRMRESHERAHRRTPDQHRIIIFGGDNQAFALAQQLLQQGRDVVVANITEPNSPLEQNPLSDLQIQVIAEISEESLQRLGADKAHTMVAMLDEEQNFTICETAYEHFGTEHLITLLPPKSDASRFYRIGVLIVAPATAMVNLLDLFVRSPSTATLLLGQERQKDILEVEVLNRNLHGKTLRHLHLPAKCLVLSVQRGGSALISHGYTRLRLHDEVTIVGDRDSLREVERIFYGAGN